MICVRTEDRFEAVRQTPYTILGGLLVDNEDERIITSKKSLIC